MATTIHDILFEIRLKAETEREKARKEWEERPHILYTPMGNRR